MRCVLVPVHQMTQAGDASADQPGPSNDDIGQRGCLAMLASDKSRVIASQSGASTARTGFPLIFMTGKRRNSKQTLQTA
jgi:hypothetical protein